MKKVAIPAGMQKFYGTGTMLHPDEDMVREIMIRVPSGQLVTIDEVCRKMSKDHNTTVACPMRTTNLVKAIAQDAIHQDTMIPFWRVIRKNHQLINSPLRAFCMANLEKEGFEVVEDKKGQYKVSNAEMGMFTFHSVD